MSVEWPKKKDYQNHFKGCACKDCWAIFCANEMHASFMKVIEAQALHPDTINWNKGGKLALEFLNKSQPQDETIKITNADDFDSGMKKLKEIVKSKYGDNVKCNCSSQPQLIPLDEKEAIDFYVEDQGPYSFPAQEEQNRKWAIKFFSRFCNAFGQSKEKLVATDNDCAGFVIAFEQRMLQKTNQGLRGEERGYLQSMVKNFCSKFGIPSKPDEVTVEDWQELVHKHGNQNAHYSSKIAQAIHERIKGGK